MHQLTEIQLESMWAKDARWKGITRPYTAKDVVRLRGTVHVEHSLARLGAELVVAAEGLALPADARLAQRTAGVGAAAAGARPGAGGVEAGADLSERAVLVERAADSPYLLAGLAFIHREWWCYA